MEKKNTVEILISTRAAINFRRTLDPAAIGGRHLLEELEAFFKFSVPIHAAPIRGQLLLEARRLLEVLR